MDVNTTEIPIPEGSLQRIRANYAQLEGMVSIIAEALGIPAHLRRTLDLEHGVFRLETPAPSPIANGVRRNSEVPVL